MHQQLYTSHQQFGAEVPHALFGRTVELGSTAQQEVLRFLSKRPIHTVAMMGLIQDNGLVSPLNRGTFFGYRNSKGVLEGVALIGHAILLETTSDRALLALAEMSQRQRGVHMVMGESDRVRDFWGYYSPDGQAMRHACRELLLELRSAQPFQARVGNIRLATQSDLESIMPIQAEMAFEESGVNPLQRDVSGFRQRCSKRIEQGRTYVSSEAGKLAFKAEVVAQTSSVTYLEGVWTSEERRSTGYGLNCLSKMGAELLQRTQSICLLVNEKNQGAQQFYSRAGYRRRDVYDTIFLL